jgi:hypothetical protein
MTELWDNVALRRSVLGDALPRRLLDKIGPCSRQMASNSRAAFAWMTSCTSRT